MRSEPVTDVARDGATLRERAIHLAKPLARVELASTIDAIAFTLGRESYAVDVRYVFAVFRLASLTPLPGARPPVAGVTVWRGDVLTVLDIRRLIGATPTALDDLARVIVLGRDRPELGLLADRIDDPLQLAAGSVHPLPPERANRGSEILSGVTTDAVVIVDASALLARQSAAEDLTPRVTP